MSKKRDPQQVIEQWTERDLSAACDTGELPPAFELEEELAQVAELVAAGKHPVLVGDAGVGKTSLVHALLRRVRSGRGPRQLEGRRVLQMSLRRRASGLQRPEQLRKEMQALVDALGQIDEDVVPYFRDFDLAFQYDLEPHFLSMVFRLAGPVLCEGERARVNTLFEYNPDLAQHYVVIEVEEPGLEKTARILAAWSEAEQSRHGRLYHPQALEEALHLTHRFLARQRLPRKAVDLLVQTSSIVGPDTTVGPEAVIERFAVAHGVPRFLVDPEVAFDIGRTLEHFSSRVLGQADAVQAVVEMVSLVKAGLADPRRPFGVFLFVGPTGVGKTHLAQQLAEYLFGARERLVRFNMADYRKEEHAFILFGNPNAEQLPQIRGALTQRLIAHPFAVLLLDEFEKAHTDIHDRFFQLVDEGSFINGAGETVACRSTVIIATSNAGAEVYRGQALGFALSNDLDAMDRELDRRLEQIFRVEFLNRFDRLVHFHPLTRDHIRAIALRELEELRQRAGLLRRELRLEVDESVVDWLTVHGYDPHHGARFLRRTIERHVTTALAQALVRHETQPGTSVTLTAGARSIVASVDPPEREQNKRGVVKLPVGTKTETRTLDRKLVEAEAQSLLEAAASRLLRLKSRQDERSRLIARMNETALWEDPERSRRILADYRDLEVVIRVEERMARSLVSLRELRDGEASASPELHMLARSVEQAARALHDWDEREALSGAGAVWLLIGNVDALRPAPDWIRQLVSMELAWCSKLHLTAEVVAYALYEGDPVWAALEVEGPGAESFLAMERGVHRLQRSEGHDIRARLDVITKSETPEKEWPDLKPVRPRESERLFSLSPGLRGRYERPDTGLVLDFLASERHTLSALLWDLDRSWRDAAPETFKPARSYGASGRGVRDPRTGVQVSRMKDVLAGELDRFLEGWRRTS